jgi:hypothetical protein
LLKLVELYSKIPFVHKFLDLGGSGAMWNMGQSETSLYFCMKQVLKLPCSTNQNKNPTNFNKIRSIWTKFALVFRPKIEFDKFGYVPKSNC